MGPRPILSCLAAGALSSLPFHFPECGFLAFVAYVPYLWAIRRLDTADTLRASLIFGFTHFLCVGYWLAFVNVPGMLLAAAYLALYPALFGLAARRFLDRRVESLSLAGAWKECVAIPALWVLSEYLRGVLLFGGMPWALTGHSQWKNLAFIQIADVTGVHGVSFFVMLVNACVHHLVRYPLKRSRRTAPGAAVDPFETTGSLWRWSAAVLVAAVALVGGYGAWALSARERSAVPARALQVCLLQGNIPQEEKWDAKIKGIIFEKYRRLTLMGAVERSDLIVWPETSFPGFLEDEPVMSAKLRSIVRQSLTWVLVGAPTLGSLDRGLRFHNSAILYGPDGEETGRYHKLHLVPFGEYIPLEPVFGFLRHFVEIGRFSPGREPVVFDLATRYQTPPHRARFAVLICFEDIFPGLVRDARLRGAEFFINMTNDAWFGRSSAPYQHAQASVFRAVENRVPVVRAANTGLSCFITAEGRIDAVVHDNGQELFVTSHRSHPIALRPGLSVYTRAGDWFVAACAALALLAFRRRRPAEPVY